MSDLTSTGVKIVASTTSEVIEVVEVGEVETVTAVSQEVDLTLVENPITIVTSNLAAPGPVGPAGPTSVPLPQIETLVDAATVTPNVDSFDGGKLLTLSQTTTIANPVGTPVPFQRYLLRIKSSTSRTLIMDTQFRAGADIPIPIATSGNSLTDFIGFQWNAEDLKWDIVALARGF